MLEHAFRFEVLFKVASEKELGPRPKGRNEDFVIEKRFDWSSRPRVNFDPIVSVNGSRRPSKRPNLLPEPGNFQSKLRKSVTDASHRGSGQVGRACILNS